MSGASDAALQLRADVAAPLIAVSTAVRATIDAQTALKAASDIVDVMQASAGVVLAMEALQEVAGQAEKHTRQVLAAAMSDTGATTIQTDAHIISLRDAAQVVLVTDRALIPPAFMRARDPEPDKVTIGKLLRDGKNVPGTILGNGGNQTIQIRSRT